MNAYAHWGRCHSEKYGNDYHWQSSGTCWGTMEAGKFGSRINYADHHSSAADWDWTEATNDVRKFRLRLSSKQLGWIDGTMPYNWHTLTVTRAEIDNRYFLTGQGGAKGEPGGPLYVDLASHSYVIGGFSPHNGYSLNLRGYLHEIPPPKD
jgi:hypothetical protein